MVLKYSISLLILVFLTQKMGLVAHLFLCKLPLRVEFDISLPPGRQAAMSGRLISTLPPSLGYFLFLKIWTPAPEKDKSFPTNIKAAMSIQLTTSPSLAWLSCISKIWATALEKDKNLSTGSQAAMSGRLISSLLPSLGYFLFLKIQASA